MQVRSFCTLKGRSDNPRHSVEDELVPVQVDELQVQSDELALVQVDELAMMQVDELAPVQVDELVQVQVDELALVLVDGLTLVQVDWLAPVLVGEEVAWLSPLGVACWWMAVVAGSVARSMALVQSSPKRRASTVRVFPMSWLRPEDAASRPDKFCGIVMPWVHVVRS